MQRRWWILAAITLCYFFLNAATFTSLGVALYSMIDDLRWSHTAAGFSFTLLGIACGLSSPLPAISLKRLGARWTVTIGGILLTLGFLLASRAEGLLGFYVAMILLGSGFTMSGNVPAVWLISAWFPGSTPRVLGFYLMTGAAGAVAGPPLVQAIIAASGGWRFHWLAMGISAATIALFGYLCIRELRDKDIAAARGPAGGSVVPAEDRGWTYRGAAVTTQFLLITAVMMLNLACVTTIHSVAVSHLKLLGATPAGAALTLSAMALIATLAKGVAGPLCERFSTRHLVAAGVVLQALGIVVFASAGHPVAMTIFSVSFGLGWGTTYVASTVLLLEYYGREIGAQMLALSHMISTVAAAGPLIAGATADHFGTFTPVFYLYTIALMLVALPIVMMEKPTARIARDAEEAEALA